MIGEPLPSCTTILLFCSNFRQPCRHRVDLIVLGYRWRVGYVVRIYGWHCMCHSQERQSPRARGFTNLDREVSCLVWQCQRQQRRNRVRPPCCGTSAPTKQSGSERTASTKPIMMVNLRGRATGSCMGTKQNRRNLRMRPNRSLGDFESASNTRCVSPRSSSAWTTVISTPGTFQNVLGRSRTS